MNAIWQNTNLEVIKLLIASGADVNARNRKTGDITVLMTGAFLGRNPEVIKLLLDSGADVHARDVRSMQAVDYMAMNTHLMDTDIHQVLKDATNK